MSSVITVRRADEILVLTDGVARKDAIEIEFSKCVLIPCAPVVVALRGSHTLGMTFAGYCLGNAMSFDEIVDRGANLFRHYFERSPEWSPEEKQLFESSEFYLSGLSQQRQALSTYHVAMDDRYQFRGQSAFAFRKIEDEISIAPGGPEIEPHLQSVGYNFPEPGDFDPAIHGLQIMTAQRMISDDYAQLIGRHIQLSTVKADGTVSARVIYRWPGEASELT